MNVPPPGPSSLHVVIIGGGPAGTACALRIKLLAAERGRDVAVTVIEGKEFQGEQHYNQCVGVLSPPLPTLLSEDLQVEFPQHLVRTPITGYCLHTPDADITLEDEHPSMALRRVQYDAYMLELALARGVQVVRARAVDLEFHEGGVLVYTENSPVEGDVVVGAFGLDEGGAALFSRLTGYQPPRALSSVVTKYHPGGDSMEAFGSRIHAFLPRELGVEFAGITPKGNHLTINIAGREVEAELMDQFIRQPWVKRHLPNLGKAGSIDPSDLRFFKGRFPSSRAGGYYGNRFVMVGDAAGLVRSFKGKGVTTAVQTGIRAAETILNHGCERKAFHGPYRQANQDLLQDLPYGQIMRLITIWLSRTGLLDVVIRGGDREPALREALIGAVAGVVPYGVILRTMMKPGNIRGVLKGIKNTSRA